MRYSCTALLGLLCLFVSVNANRYRDEYIAEASQPGARFAASANSYFAPSSYSITGPGFSSAGSDQIYNAGNMRSDLPSDVPYWWMNNGSPFKHQNHGAKGDDCGEKGAASNNVEIRKSEGYEMDLSKNPFFNGNYVAAASAPAAAQHHLTAAATQINVASNPFLNGNSASFGASGPAVQFGLTAPGSNQFGGSAPGGFRQASGSFSGPSPTGFGQTQFAGSNSKAASGSFQSNLIAGSSNNKQGFAQGQPKFSSSGSSFGAATHNGYLPPEPSTIRCYGQGKTCALKQQCAGGYISEYSVDLNSIRNNDDQFCNIETEVCCSIQYATTVRPTQPPPPQSTPCLDREYTCVAPDLCRNGVIRVNSNTLRDQLSPANQKCYAPEVCCRYPDETFGQNQLIPNQLKPTTTPAPYIPPAPPVTTQRPYVPPVTTQRPYVPPVTTQRPYVPPVTTQRPYVPPVTTQRPYVPPVTTQRPYVPPVTTQRPYVPPVTTKAPYIGDQYIPPVDKDGQPSNNQGTNILPPYKGQDSLSEPNPNPAAANNRPTIVNPNISIDLIPTSCAAALNCTEEQFCNMTGFISKTPVILTPLEKQNQVPMTDCRNKLTNTIGKCCRDPDYTDPWPVGQLGQYNPQILNKVFNDGSYKPVNGNGKLSSSNVNRQFVRPAPTTGVCCTRRDLNSQPRGAGPIDTGFGEIPWQAMILFEPNRTLVCGGSIIQDDIIITAAHCTYGLPARDIMIKGGEWRLGVDEEPKTFQIVRVKTISYHPLYNPATLGHDVALLHLEEKIRFDTHMSPICLDETEPAPTANCITTGWGKEVLRINIQNALMHWSPVGIRPHNECEGTFGNNYNKKVTVCGKTKADSCDVDVGSALACVDSNGCYKLMGVYSTESQCGASPSQLTTFARIDLKWIAAAIKNPGADVLPEYVPEPNNPYEYKASLPSTQAPLYLPPQ